MKYTNGYEKIKVTIMDIAKNPFKTFWDVYKMTWNNLQNIEFNKDDKFIMSKCRDVLIYKALPIPMEMIQVRFKIEGLSRVALAQITRGRIGWAFNVESQMPAPINHNVTIPLNIVESKFKDKTLKLIEDSQNLYDELIAAGFPPQDCRYLTLHGQQTNMIANTNYAALRQFYSRRACNSLTDELNYVSRLLKREISIMIDLGKIDNCWTELLPALDSSCARRKVCNNSDKTLGCCGRYGVKSITSNYKFSRTAWQLELNKMHKSLLFPDENYGDEK